MKINSFDLALEEIRAFRNFLPSIQTREEKAFDEECRQRLERINEISLAVPSRRPELMKACFELCGNEVESSLIIKQARQKPFGYPGDYLLIDWIYINKLSPDKKGMLWDKMFLRQPAAQAVRNRKEFFIKILQMQNSKVSVLNLGCGSARDVLEAMQLLLPSPSLNYSFHCVDQEQKAIAFAQELIGDLKTRFAVRWETRNVFRFRPQQKYTLIWSAGLFDYLNDRLAAALIGRMWQWLEDGGRIVIGNFHPDNPNKNQMEWCLAWFLNYRTEKDMVEICKRAGIPERNITVEREALGINLFLEVKKQSN